MTHGSQVYVSPVQRFVWIQIALSSHCGASGYERLRRRLAGFLAGSGICPVTTSTRILLLGASRSVTAMDSSMVVAWLVEQPEVVLVRSERPQGRPTSRRSRG